ncbi:MAG: CHASE2 domain-containing protein [Gammaproteobacteria bacterium]|nr:CHASE2 domain-containing protein [Gammaproteobacteria bacterium]
MLLTPLIQDWEEDLGLSWLFHARGVVQTPKPVVVISIDKSSSGYFNLPNLTRKWPRTLHAKLLGRLREADARVVAFDIFFKTKREGMQDGQFAAAIKQSDNVVLFSFLQKQVMEAVDPEGGKSHLVVNELIAPQSVFSGNAISLAPNPLPKVPVKVSQFWKFVPEAGDAPTLPVVAYQLYHINMLADFIDVLSKVSPENMDNILVPGGIVSNKKQLVSVMKQLRELLANDQGIEIKLADALNRLNIVSSKKQIMLQMLELYSGVTSQYLNYYGPARSVTTIPYYKVLESDDVLASLKDKLVFIGFSEHRQWEQQDGFYSVYSGKDGLDISGVEITATAAANLIDGRSVQPLSLSGQIGVLLLISIFLVAVFSRLRGVWLPVSLISIGVAYFFIASGLFSQNGIWLPLFIPLFILIPVVMIIGMVWNYQEINIERKNIQRAFGYYLPEAEVNRLARDIAGHGLGGQTMHGVCLSTDAQQYTTLSEKLTPQQLTEFMNEYYEAIFRPVRQCGGIISDVVGDSVMALWASPKENSQHRERAITAAIAIISSVNKFNTEHPGYELPTRIGLHYGSMVIGNVGAVDHYEYRAVGDIVNTTSRIEGMSKHLGTRLLVSADVIEGLQGFMIRSVGRFTLKGKTVPMELFEVASDREMEPNEQRWYKNSELFKRALTSFQTGEWTEACQLFKNVLQDYPEDNPAIFYKNYCEQNKFTPPENWRGVISMETK